MGTYDDSKIRKARKPHRCNGASLCEIKTGEKYLDYKAGMYNSVRVCMKHAYLYPCAATQGMAR